MPNIVLEISEIPHGHGLSFKKGVADGLLSVADQQSSTHETHAASYHRGVELGAELKKEIAKYVKE